MYRVEVTNSGTSQFQVKSKDYEFTVDTQGKGMTPPDVLLASLGSCIGVYARKYALGAGIVLDNIAIVVEAEFSKESPAHFESIDVSIGLGEARIEPRRMAALVEFIKNCPIHTTLHSKPQININIK